MSPVNKLSQFALLAIFAILSPEYPIAYRPPTTLPILVPIIRSGTISKESKACNTGICAIPFAPPPLKTKTTLGFLSCPKTCVETTNEKKINNNLNVFFITMLWS